jgi:arylsulfatase A-like enzyme
MSAALQKTKRRPNVVVFFTDQQRWDCSGLHGNPLDLMPNFDRMATMGTHLFHSFTCQPVCGPARASLQTGLYGTTSGCWRNDRPLQPHHKALGHYFRDGGYKTGYVGKWHLATQDPVPREERGGYDYWLAANLLEMTSDAYDCVLYDGDNNRIKLPGYRVDALADAAIRFIDQNQNDLFYLFLSFLEPHHQNHRDDYPAPEGYAERYTGRWTPPDLQDLSGSSAAQLGGYFGMVKRLDEALGRVLETLTSLGLRDDTVVLFTSDHGCHFKTRNEEYKRAVHDAAIRVPTAFGGGVFSGGGQVRQLVSLIDLPPTLLDAAGLPVPDEMQGRSLVPLLHNRNTQWPDDVFVQISESQVGRAIRTSRWKYGVVAKDKNGWRDADSDHYTEAHLYDLLADPYELSNLIECESHREVARVMRERLLRRMNEAGETAPQIIEAECHQCGQRRVLPGEELK